MAVKLSYNRFAICLTEAILGRSLEISPLILASTGRPSKSWQSGLESDLPFSGRLRSDVLLEIISQMSHPQKLCQTLSWSPVLTTVAGHFAWRLSNFCFHISSRQILPLDWLWQSGSPFQNSSTLQATDAVVGCVSKRVFRHVSDLVIAGPPTVRDSTRS